MARISRANFVLYLSMILLVLETADGMHRECKGHVMLTMYYHSTQQLNFIAELMPQHQLQPIDLSEVHRRVTMMVPSDSYGAVIKALRSEGIPYRTEDIEREIELEEEEEDLPADVTETEVKRALHEHTTRVRRSALSDEEQMDVLFYNSSIIGKVSRHAEINHWMDFGPQVKPDLVEVINIGFSTENRPLNVIKIGKSTGNRPSIWIDANIHAREWITAPTAVYVIKQLIQGYGRDERVTALVDRFNWYILPIANPDGFEYTVTTDRCWRKTRSHIEGSECYGVDPNRNWGYHWLDCCSLNPNRTCDNPWSASSCASTDPCNYGIYAGPKAFSEPETKAMSDFLLQSPDDFVAFVSLHGYMPAWLLPYGYTNAPPSDIEDLKYVANRAVDAIEHVHGARFTVGAPGELMYNAAGSSFDWTKDEAGIKYSYGMELRNGGGGFIVHKEEIQKSAEEMWEGLQTMAEAIVERSPELFQEN